MREIRNVKELRKRAEKLKKKGYSISEIADELDLKDCDVRYILTTKNNKIKNRIKEHKEEIIGLGMITAGCILLSKVAYDSGFKNGVDVNTATSLKVIDDPEWFLNHDAIPLLIGTKANGTFHYALKEGAQFVEEILKLSTKAENL